MKKDKLIPKRRFKEFENDEAWEQRKLDEVFVKLQNNSLSRAQLNYKEGRAYNVHYGDILIKFGEYLDVKKEQLPYINNDISIDNYRTSFLKNGDILFADAAEDETVGKCCEIQGLTTEIVISGLHTIPCRPVENFSNGYLGYYLNSNAYHNQLLPLMQGTKVSSISRSTIDETYAIYPKSKEEQMQIGLFFKNLDKLIILQQDKIKKLKNLKSAYLSEMFPKEGEKYPKRRFAGFTDPWEQRKLGELAEIIGGGTPNTTNPDYWGGDIDWYTPAEMEGQIYASGSKRKVTEVGLKNSSAKILPAHRTVLFTSRAGIGKTAILKRPGATNQGFQSLVLNDEYNPYFIYSLSNQIKKKAEAVASGSTFLEISGKVLGKLEILVPRKQEQDAIAQLFKGLDSLITLHQNKLEKLENLKKAYLNEMFV